MGWVLEKMRGGQLGCVPSSGGALGGQEPTASESPTSESDGSGDAKLQGVGGQSDSKVTILGWAEEQRCQVKIPRGAEVPQNNGRP